MVWCRKKSVVRFLTLILVFVMSFSMFVVPTYASGSQASTEDGVGTSLYDVTTALTAYASNVVGSNTNDKQVDESNSPVSAHQVWILKNADVGDAGAIVGYGDKQKGFIAFVTANETRSVTTSNYAAYKNIGDNNKTYAYVRYGRLLTTLGLDETGNPASADYLRFAGYLVEGAHMVSRAVPWLFSVSINILRFLNPFRFLVDSRAVNGVITDVSASNAYNAVDPFNQSQGLQGASGLVTGAAHADPMTGVNEYNGASSTIQYGGSKSFNVATSGLQKVARITTMLYVWCRNIGMFIIVPFLTLLLIASLLLTRSNDKWGKVATYAKRLFFIFVGVPFLGIIYTSVLDTVEENIVTNAPSSRIVAATFVDFENWAKIARLDPPASMTSEVADDTPGGKPSADTIRTVRDYAYTVNRKTNLYYLPVSSGLGIGSSGRSFGLNAGMWDDNGWKTMGSSGGTIQAQFDRMNALLSTYAAGHFYTASAWESAINTTLKALYASDMGSSPTTSGASPNKNTVYQMYFDTDEVEDWMNRAAVESQHIFKGDSAPEEAQWAPSSFNIFKNGGSLGLGDASGGGDYEYSGSGWGGRVGLATTGAQFGLSTVSMYNYLASAFNASNIAVYSAANTTSEYTRVQHYSVNAVGSGLLGALFIINTIVVLGIFSLVALCYCLGMIGHNLKTGFSMIMAIPGAMFGIMKSIVQVVVYVINMIITIIATAILYSFICDLIIIFASLIESPVQSIVENVTETSIAGGLFASLGSSNFVMSFAENTNLFVLGIGVVTLATLVLGVGMYATRRCVLVAEAYAFDYALRCQTAREFLPVFDEIMAKRKSMYFWDELAYDVDDVASASKEILDGLLPDALPEVQVVPQVVPSGRSVAGL